MQQHRRVDEALYKHRWLGCHRIAGTAVLGPQDRVIFAAATYLLMVQQHETGHAVEATAVLDVNLEMP